MSGKAEVLVARDAGYLTERSRSVKLVITAGSVRLAELVSRAEVAELADAHGSGPCTRKGVKVRVLSSAPSFLDSK